MGASLPPICRRSIIVRREPHLTFASQVCRRCDARFSRASCHAAGADPCRFAEADLREMLTDPAWRDARAIGVAFFPEPDATAPISTLVAVAR